MFRYLLPVFALFAFVAGAGACEHPYKMKLVLDLNTADMNAVVKGLKETAANTVTTSIAWSVVEPVEGQFSFEPYRRAFEQLIRNGYCLNIILDTSGRLLLGSDRRPIKHNQAAPHWLTKKLHKRVFARDFYGNDTSAMLSVADESHLPYLRRMYDKSLDFLDTNFRNHIAFVTPGVSSELEIKYSQSGYRFQDYSPEAQVLFHRYMAAKGKPEIDMPVIDYQAFFAGGAPRPHPYRDDLQEFRKELLVSYYCARTATIRLYGFKAFGYFGGPFQLHDMIYASGVIEKMPPCFDAIAVDNNFFNGHAIDARPEYVATIVNYAVNLGFKEVVVGLYTERLGLSGMGPQTIHDTLAKALQAVNPSRSLAGIEIGGFEITDQSARTIFSPDMTHLVDAITRDAGPRKYTIAILGSLSTFELWQGEYYFNRSIHQEALDEAVKMFAMRPDITVKVVSEANLEQQAARADAIYLPHVTAPSAGTVSAINKLIKRGKPVIQDVRFGEFRPDGSMNPDYPLPAFGVSESQWMASGADFIYNGKTISLPAKPSNFYASHLEMSAKQGFSLEAKDGDTGIFLRGPNTLVLGVVPQFLNQAWQDLALAAIISMIDERRRPI